MSEYTRGDVLRLNDRVNKMAKNKNDETQINVIEPVIEIKHFIPLQPEVPKMPIIIKTTTQKKEEDKED